MDERFEWNVDKAALNHLKHGVSFEDAATVLMIRFTLPCLMKNIPSMRNVIYTVGVSAHNNVLMIAHMDRDERIRISSARKATTHERRFYEEEQ